MAENCWVVLPPGATDLTPRRAMSMPCSPLRVCSLALLAALIAVQTLGAGQSLVVDARVPAIIVAAALYAVRTPFIVVVAVAALVAAGIRLFT